MSTQTTKVLSIVGLIILGIVLFLSGIFFGRMQTSAGFYPGGMMLTEDGYVQGGAFGSGMMGDFANNPGSYGSATNGYGMMDGSFGNTPGGFGMMDSSFGNNPGSFGMMGGSYGNMPGGSGMMNGSYGNMPGGYGMMGGNFGNTAGYGAMMGSGMMGGLGTATTEPFTIEEAQTAVTGYLASLNNDNLTTGEVMIFDNHAYAQAVDKETGEGAFEVLIDPVTGNVFPEPGPNMMWNSEYSPMAGMMGAGMMGGSSMMGSAGYASTIGEVNVTGEQAIDIAQEYLDATLPGTTADDHATPFPGYYTLHILNDGETIGMLSVNAYTSEVFPHFWHGDFIEMAE